MILSVNQNQRKGPPMIHSILDNDLYKFTMQQAVHRLYPNAMAEYEFTNRGKTPFPRGFAKEVEQQIRKMAVLTLSTDEKRWLGQACPYLTKEYLDLLSTYGYDPNEVSLSQTNQTLGLKIRGTWWKTILWEVPLMAVISETYFTMTQPGVLDREQIRQRNQAKAARMANHGISFADFGTRRRFSAANHEQLITDILDFDGHTLGGTSNVHLARKFNLAPIGTLAHEWIMFHSALGSYTTANTLAMDKWYSVYKGLLGIALTDTYTTDAFLSVFDEKQALRFGGVRQDSGDPVEFSKKLIRHYENLGIDPGTKTIVFSDGLNVDRTLAIHQACKGRIKDTYGIGTHLTNDLGAEPLNMVIKLSRCRPGLNMDWQDTVKLSDDPGKHTGNDRELARCLNTLGADRLSPTASL